jgi:hypothetical protein
MKKHRETLQSFCSSIGDEEICSFFINDDAEKARLIVLEDFFQAGPQMSRKFGDLVS